MEEFGYYDARYQHAQEPHACRLEFVLDCRFQRSPGEPAGLFKAYSPVTGRKGGRLWRDSLWTRWHEPLGTRGPAHTVGASITASSMLQYHVL